MPHPTLRRCRRWTPALLITWVTACGDKAGPPPEITGYTASGQANGTDPVTSEELACAFLTGELATGGPLAGSWTGSTWITVIRYRKGDSQRVTYDTMIASQEVTLSRIENGQFQLSAAGPFADTLRADVDTALPGYSSGRWTCGPEHPLARVHPGLVLDGNWQTQPVIPLAE
jgi:hypothetical protein